MIRVLLPAPLAQLAGTAAELRLEVAAPFTQRRLLDALEARHPALAGTTRDHATGRRRAYLRFFAAGQDLSQDAPDALLPEAVVRGIEPFMIVGAVSGG